MSDDVTLQKILDLISVPGQHAIGAAARDKDGIECSPHDPDAACWCIIGALMKVGPVDAKSQCRVQRRLLRAANQEKYINIAHASDRGQAIAVSVVRRALANFSANLA